MKIDCGVARDLMPLVIDEVASESSVKLVKEHLSECEDCSRYWAGMRRELPETKKPAEAGYMLRQLRKIQKMRVLMIALIGLIAGCLLVWGSLIIKDKLQTEPAVPADLLSYDYRLAKLDAEHVAIIEAHDELPYAASGWSINYSADGDTFICYLSMEVPRLRSELSQDPMAEYWETWSVKEGQIMSPDHERPLAEIRKGTPSNYETLWTVSEPLPEASFELSQYLALRDQWDSLEKNIVDGVAEFVDPDAAWHVQDQMETYRYAAPELQAYTY